MNFNAARDFMLQKLESELPKHLSYHSVNHVKDVLNAATSIGESENVTPEELLLLKTAAVFHDSGFIYGAKEHEKKSCEIARKYLPDFDYTEKQMDTICNMIMATKIPQSPQSHLDEILADADLDYLGRADFFTISNQLYEELAMFGLFNDVDDWNRLQISFFEKHHYFTTTSIKMRKEKKQEHLNIIKSKLRK